jgi:MFS family permease
VLLAAVFAGAFALYLARERRAAEPMVDLRLWRTPLIARVNASALFGGATIIGVTSFVPIDVQGVLGRTAIVAGFALTAMSVGWPLASTLSSRFLRRFGARGTVRIGGGLMFLGTLLLAVMPRTAGPAWIGLGSFVIGFGMGLLNTTFIILIQGSVVWEQRGSATAANIFARMLGSTLGAAILGAVLNAVLHQRLGASDGGAGGIEGIRRVFSGAAQALGTADTAALTAALGDGLTRVFGVLALFGALALVAAWLVPQRAIFAPAEERVSS